MQLKRMPCQLSRTFLSTLATATLTALHLCEANSASAAPHQALSADSFVDSIGVGVHLTYGDTQGERTQIYTKHLSGILE